MLTLEEAQRKVHRLSEALANRREGISRELDYYRGVQGALRFASEKFNQQFFDQFRGFSDNWCQPVADAGPERMTVLGIRPFGQVQSDAVMNRAWERSNAAAGMHTAMVVRAAAKRSFALVAPGKTDDVPRITFESPESTIVDDDPVTRERRAALIVWADDKIEYATLYTRDEIWKFSRPTDRERWERNGEDVELTGGWQIRNEDPQPFATNPFGEVPVVEFKNRDLLDDAPMSDISGVMAMQDAINLVWAYLLNALDAATMPQRVITGAEPPSIPILDKNGQVIGKRPVELDDLLGEKILWVPNQNAKVQEWSQALLEPFSKVIERAVEHIAAQTRTPPHYLLSGLTNTAAETLTISEAGLVSKVRQAITQISPDVRDMYKLMGIAMRRPQSDIDALAAGKVMWADIQYRSEAQRADALLKKRQMGYPLRWIFEQDGQDPEQIERIMLMIQEEQTLDPMNAMRSVENQVADDSPRELS